MDLYLCEPVGPFPSGLGTAQNTFTTKKDVTGQGTLLPVIPGGKLRPGSLIKVEAEGEYSTTGTPTLQWGLWLGTRAGAITTDLALSSAITTPSAAAAFPWRLEWRAKVTAVGTAGSLTGCGNVEYGTSLTAVTTIPIPITQALRTVAIDTTIERAIGVAAAWGTSSASNSITVYNVTVILQN